MKGASKVKKEYRWEFEEIGQGHYFVAPSKCLQSAQQNSIKRPDLVVKVEQFKPNRKTIARFINGTFISFL